MSNAPAVTFAKHGEHIAIVTIDRPDASNAVNAAVAQRLSDIVAEVEADPDIWVAVLTGAGDKVFCAGADLKEVAAGRVSTLFTPGGGFAGYVHAKRTKPWIAAVEGLALAGGCEIALASDLIIASEGGAFGLPEVLRGLAASAGGLYRLPRAIPKGLALGLILTAERLPSEQAAQLGMVYRLAPAGKAMAVALDLAQTIAGNAPLAVRESLAIVRQAYDLDDAALRKLSDEAQARLERTEDFYEGAQAFVEKRAPAWRGA